MRLLASIIFLLVPFLTLGQEGETKLGKYKVNKHFCLRIEHGWHKSWFTSLGASYVYSNVNSHAPLTFVLYASTEGNLVPYGTRTPFYAYKAGFEAGGMLIAYGAEVRNNTDFAGNDHLIFMPKIGLSLFSHVNIFYGYNIFRTANNIFGINHSQLSLNVNLYRKIFTESLVPGG